MLTSAYIDTREDNQNDVMTIKGLSSDRKTVVFTSKMKFDHYGGAEYQVEYLRSRFFLLPCFGDGGFAVVI